MRRKVIMVVIASLIFTSGAFAWDLIGTRKPIRIVKFSPPFYYISKNTILTPDTDNTDNNYNLPIYNAFNVVTSADGIILKPVFGGITTADGSIIERRKKYFMYQGKAWQISSVVGGNPGPLDPAYNEDTEYKIWFK